MKMANSAVKCLAQFCAVRRIRLSLRRLNERQRLRAKDIDLLQNQIVVRAGKGDIRACALL
jgi:hypothetical protein